LATVPRFVFSPRRSRPFLEVALGSSRQKYAPRFVEVGAGLIEAVSGAMGLLARFGAPPAKSQQWEKADCSSEAEHANGLQAGRNGHCISSEVEVDID
jgi:hypothetical protein